MHYQAYSTPEGEYPLVPRAAIITAVDVDPESSNAAVVSLAVLSPTGLFFDEWVPWSPVPQAGFWNWPPRV
ncbi:hypothetical protein CROSSROADS_109 [Mycobacterium phage Crossroads]|uniref:hypothetical protein n=1 Tax=Mycobacterium phage Crossroads TaxID=1340836 RepID=UPI0003881527|nr:hypothetical protein N848_gp133 [Mycobacterium phage Crossroads]AGT13106.1 hypothetical protein CROSSROADS_109 [Mycobacterium phage Crossroads]ALY07428.1 hypothetical protein SEA_MKALIMITINIS3_109 [Mycobacterium phage MkaliMitinis3]